MNKKRRDDFSEATKRLLHSRVNGFCSKPDCRIVTRGPNSTDSKVTSVGQAAHITAASEGGPRYDSSISSDERKSYKNGIWLCNIHARMVDVDPKVFSTEELIQWKQEAEKYSESVLGKSMLTEEEANTISTEKMSSFFLGDNANNLSSGLANIVNHVDRKLSDLDPRFLVKTSIIDGNVSRSISAKEAGVKLDLFIDSEHADQFKENYERIELLGGEFEIPTDAVSVDGSALFNNLFSGNLGGGCLKVSKPEATFNANLYVSTDTHPIFLSSARAKLSSTPKARVMTASALKDFVRMISESRFDNARNTALTTYTFDFTKWVGLDVLKIPFFS